MLRRQFRDHSLTHQRPVWPKTHVHPAWTGAYRVGNGRTHGPANIRIFVRRISRSSGELCPLYLRSIPLFINWTGHHIQAPPHTLHSTHTGEAGSGPSHVTLRQQILMHNFRPTPPLKAGIRREWL